VKLGGEYSNKNQKPLRGFPRTSHIINTVGQLPAKAGQALQS
jgi:hypothetical protein